MRTAMQYAARQNIGWRQQAQLELIAVEKFKRIDTIDLLKANLADLLA
jgi:hypothetical protein